MVKLKGPSISTEASGKLADALIFSTSKNRAYLKRHAAPANPRTGPQTSARAAIKFLSQAWKQLSPTEQATWAKLALPSEVAPYHAFIGQNAARWTTFRAPSKAYPAPEIPPPPIAPILFLTGGVGMISLRIGQRTPNNTWGAIAFRARGPLADFPHSTCVLWTPLQPVAINDTIDTPLEPGAYWYVVRTFSINGLMSLPSATRTEIVT